MHYDAHKLRKVMDAQGRRADWLADQMEYHETHIYKVLNGHTPMSAKFAQKAARVLGVPVEFFESREKEIANAAG